VAVVGTGSLLVVVVGPALDVDVGAVVAEASSGSMVSAANTWLTRGTRSRRRANDPSTT
jgi:hypothetical protein